MNNNKTIEPTYCEGTVGIFLCGICNEPIKYNEPMIDVSFSKRIKMGNLELLRSNNLHERCAINKFGDFINTESEYDMNLMIDQQIERGVF